MNITHIEQLFNNINTKVNRWRNSNTASVPWIEYYAYIRGKYLSSGELLPSDIDFLEVVAQHEIVELKHKAYVWGKWYDIIPKQVEYYNLTNTIRPKLVKKCKPLKVMR